MKNEMKKWWDETTRYLRVDTVVYLILMNVAALFGVVAMIVPTSMNVFMMSDWCIVGLAIEAASAMGVFGSMIAGKQ